MHPQIIGIECSTCGSYSSCSPTAGVKHVRERIAQLQQIVRGLGGCCSSSGLRRRGTEQINYRLASLRGWRRR